MPLVLYDRALAPRLRGLRGDLVRGSYHLAGAPSSRLLERARLRSAHAVLIADRHADRRQLGAPLAADPALIGLRVLVVAEQPLSEARRLALRATGVSWLELPASADRLSRALANLLDLPTRVVLGSEAALAVLGASESETVRGTVRDISTGGIRLETDQALETGDLVVVRFALDPSEPPLVTTLRVRRHAPGSGEYGLEFFGIRLAERRRIARIVGTRALIESASE